MLSRSLFRNSFLAISILIIFSLAQASITNADDRNCVIPPSGPWPSCATGGSVTTQPTTTNNTDCIIPPSGPWPPCATGSGSEAQPSSTHSECVIPSSGPWPLCVRGNAQQSNNGSGECVIPPSGPWPPCAKGNAQSSSNSSRECVIPPSGAWPPCATGTSTASSESNSQSPTNSRQIFAPDRFEVTLLEDGKRKYVNEQGYSVTVPESWVVADFDQSDFGYTEILADLGLDIRESPFRPYLGSLTEIPGTRLYAIYRDGRGMWKRDDFWPRFSIFTPNGEHDNLEKAVEAQVKHIESFADSDVVATRVSVSNKEAIMLEYSSITGYVDVIWFNLWVNDEHFSISMGYTPDYREVLQPSFLEIVNSLEFSD